MALPCDDSLDWLDDLGQGMPTRIRLRRTKGWRLPPGTVCVARPSNWGNSFVVGGVDHKTGERILDRAHAVRLFEQRWFGADVPTAALMRDAAIAEVARQAPRLLVPARRTLPRRRAAARGQPH